MSEKTLDCHLVLGAWVREILHCSAQHYKLAVASSVRKLCTGSLLAPSNGKVGRSSSKGAGAKEREVDLLFETVKMYIGCAQ